MVVSAGAALKIGLSGVGNAVKAAFDPGTKPEDLQKALDKLAPQARDFVVALRGLKPEFDALKKSVQGELFTELDSVLKTTAGSVLPVLKSQLTTSATALGNMGAAAALTAGQLADDGTLGKALGGANKGLSNLSMIPARLTKGLVQIGAAAAPSFDRLTAAAGRGADSLSAKLNKAFASGGMQRAIDQAVSLIGQLVTVGANVGKVLGGVFSAAQATGGGTLGILQTVTGELAKIVNSDAVQTGLKALFGTMSQLAKVAAPLLGQALSLVGPVLAALGPPAQTLITALGAGLKPVITALGPVLLTAAGAVGSLATAVAPLLPVIGRMIASLGPVLTPVLGVVGSLFTALAPVLAQLGKSLLPPVATLTKTLSTAFALLAPVLQTALGQLGSQGLTPVIAGLGAVLGQIVTQYSAAFLNLFQQLLPVIPQLVPVLVQLGQSLGQILTAVAPLVPQLALMGAQLVTAVLPAILPLIPPLASLTVLLLRLATGVITRVVIPVIGGMVKVMSALGTALRPAVDAVTWVTKAIAGSFRWLYDLLLGHSIIPDIVNGTVRWFAGLPGRAGAALAGLAGSIAGRAADAGARLAGAVRRGLDGAVSWIRRLPGMARNALGDLSGVLTGAGRSLLNGLIGGIKSKFGAVKGTLGNLTDNLTEWKGPRRKDASLLTPAGRLLIQGLIAGIGAATPALKSKLGQVTQLITRAIEINKDNRHKARGLNALSDLVQRDNKKLRTLAVQRDRIAATIAAAKTFAGDTAAAARGSAALSALGGGAPASGGTILAGLQDKLSRLRTFTSYIKTLAKRGLSKGLLRQLLEMGPEQGYAYASALAGSSATTLAAINRTQGAVNQAARGLGDRGADLLYDSGRNAGKGFLAGLTGQQKAIEKQMLRIARGMQSAIRKALGIHSPSTVMAALGGHATEGIAVGAVARLPVLERAMTRVAGTVAGTPLAFGRPQPATATGRAGHGPVVMQVTFNMSTLDPLAGAREVRRVLLELKRTYGLNIDLGVA